VDADLFSYGVVLVTTETRAEAVSIARQLVQEKLAACVSIAALESIYTWQDQLQQQQEWQMVIKTHLSRFQGLVNRIQELHSYAVPELIALPIVAGSPAYLAWMGEQLGLEMPGNQPQGLANS
jgi:periplasmic divalent cation tolerance protein